MPKPTAQRTVEPDGERLKNLRVSRGAPVEQLANHAQVSVKTIMSIEAGKPCFPSTLRRILDALDAGASFPYYIKGAAPEPIPIPKDYAVCTVLSQGSITGIDETDDILEMMNKIRQAIGSHHPILLVYIKPGSIELGLAMHHSDILRFLAAINDDSLRHFFPGLTLFRIEDDEWLRQLSKLVASATGDRGWANLAYILNQTLYTATPQRAGTPAHTQDG